jgi:Domain of unknown function (DUF4214)/Glycosyl hydrolase catalytic core
MMMRFMVIAACLLGTSAAAEADILWGVNGHPLTAYPGARTEDQLDYIKDLGMKSYRVNIPGTDKLKDLAELVKAGKERQIEILPVITPGNVDLDNDTAKELYDKAHALAFALGSQFKDDIRVWELGNEMENYAIIKACEMRDDGTQYPCEWGPAGGVDVLEYYAPRWQKVSAVLKGLSDGMTAVDPEIRKAMGTAGWGHLGAFERMQQDGIKWDISVWHTYGEDPEWAFERIAKYKKPIWVTEFNNPYGSQRGEPQQASGLKEAMTRLRELQGTYDVQAAHIYELLDETYWAPSYEAFMGLVRLEKKVGGGWKLGEPKPAYFTVRELIRTTKVTPPPAPTCDLTAAAGEQAKSARQVAYGYCLMYGQVADETAIKEWQASLEGSGGNVTDMLLKMLRSEEFKERHTPFTLNDTAFVKLLYKVLLNREADSYGSGTYVSALKSGMSRGRVAHSIISSSEFIEKHRPLFETKDASEGVTENPPG